MSSNSADRPRRALEALLGDRGLRWARRVRRRAVAFGRAAEIAAQPELLRMRPGHYYSPLSSLEERRRFVQGRSHALDALRGLDLRTEEQLALVDQLGRYGRDLAWLGVVGGSQRYQPGNEWFPVADALLYAAILRHFSPHRVIEIGCGQSSAVAVEVNDRYLGWSIELTFVDPEPQRLRSALRPGDLERVSVHAIRVQDVDEETFKSLASGDILFVDSSHVARAGSDVLRILFDLVPNVAPGVIVHFHDVDYPFEYRDEFQLAGNCWTELYLLRAFLMFNPQFEVIAFSDFLGQEHRQAVVAALPGFDTDRGSSLWIRRRRTWSALGASEHRRGEVAQS